MERYKILSTVGDGAYGNVYKAVNKATGEVVAIKKMKKKYYSWDECMSLREIKSLRKLSHPNLVKLKEVIRASDELYFVFEFLDCNVYQLMKDRAKPFSEKKIKKYYLPDVARPSVHAQARLLSQRHEARKSFSSWR
jgi:protein kinase